MPAPPLSDILEQGEARRLLRAALADPAHAYLFHGPPGVGKRAAALVFAGALLEDPHRVERRSHPDLYVLEPVGDQIRIDAVRELRHDLHLRPFEASRRVYLVFEADLMNDEAADALLKDLEEPPAYATIVLVASSLGRLPETIRSRCQHVPFRRLSQRALEQHLVRLHPTRDPAELTIASRIGAGRLDRAERLLEPEVVERRGRLVELARSVYLEPSFDPGASARAIVGLAQEAGALAAERDAEGIEGSARELDQRSRRVARGVEREEIVEALDLLAAWYRDLVAVAAGADHAAFNADRLDQLRADARVIEGDAARAAEAVVETRRAFELNVQAGLALEGLFVRLRRALPPVSAGAV